MTQKKILIVTANYYPKISSNLKKGAKSRLKKHKITFIDVPGIFEIPVIISKNINKYDGFITLGCVIKGKTPHFKFISEAVFNSLINISIKSKKPIGNGIITALNKEQAEERANPKNKDKGGEAAKAIISLFKKLV
tara:strand:- start:1131 stop:1538 length:408 start_codon:yes stop_codon:yes gene_type:complete